MRGRFGLLKSSNGVVGSRVIGEAAKRVSCSAFSTSSGDGRGRGRGRGSGMPSRFDFVGGLGRPGEADSKEVLNDSEKSHPGMGRGHGQSKPLPSSPFLPSFNTFVAPGRPSQPEPGLGRGRGGGGVTFQQSGYQEESRPKQPIIFTKDNESDNPSVIDSRESANQESVQDSQALRPERMNTVLSAEGKEKFERTPVHEERPKEENRHLRPKRGTVGRGRDRLEATSEPKPKLSREEAVKRAVGILSKESGVSDGGGRGRGRGWGRGRGRGRGRNDDDEDDDDEDDLFVGDDADGEKLAQKLGPAKMAELTEAFDDISTDVLPDLATDEYLDAVDLNYKTEFEPEYLFGDFETNPDIHDTPPISLHDALEKAKPFLMAYEGIESQEEWEEALKETMDNVPLLKEIVDHYCGPETVTAKQQNGELERVAKTIPETVPDAVKRFTDRAVLSLQSNAGWGFDKKCQFMDKLADQFTQSYK